MAMLQDTALILQCNKDTMHPDCIHLSYKITLYRQALHHIQLFSCNTLNTITCFCFETWYCILRSRDKGMCGRGSKYDETMMGVWQWCNMKLFTWHFSIRVINSVTWTPNLSHLRHHLKTCQGSWAPYSGNSIHMQISWGRHTKYSGSLAYHHSTFLLSCELSL